MLFLKHRTGAIHQLGGRRLAKFQREFRANAQSACVSLIEAEHVGFLGDDGNVWEIEPDAFVSQCVKYFGEKS